MPTEDDASTEQSHITPKRISGQMLHTQDDTICGSDNFISLSSKEELNQRRPIGVDNNSSMSIYANELYFLSYGMG